MFRYALAAVLLVSATDVRADGNPPPMPSKYDHAFAGKLYPNPVAYGEAWQACNEIAAVLDATPFPKAAMWNASAGRPLLGCAYDGYDKKIGKWCVVVWTKGKEHVRRHEIAHCNGWPANHPVD